MIEYPNGYRPLDSARTLWTRFNVSLPGLVDQRQIGVNVRGIEKLCRIGGINHLRVVSNNDGNTSQFVPTIVGFSQSGEAMASKTGVRSDVPTFDVDSERQRSASLDFLPHAATWINTTVVLNTAEIANRIKNNQDGGIRSPEAWADHINKAVKKGISSAGVKHLTLGLNKYNAVEVASQYAIIGFIEAQNPSVSSAIFKVFLVGGFLNMLAYFRTRGMGRGEEFRMSAFFGPQLDRALVLKLASQRTTLVKGFAPVDQ